MGPNKIQTLNPKYEALTDTVQALSNGGNPIGGGKSKIRRTQVSYLF